MAESNPVLDQIFSHRSVRSFDIDHEIPPEDLLTIVKAGQQASTSCSGQMYSIIEISKPERGQIVGLCGNQKFVSEASYFAIICVDMYRLHRIVEASGGNNPDWPMTGLMIGIFDAGLMAQNMVLAAESLGYDICFCGSCGDHPAEMVEALDLPPLVMPLTGLAIGKGTEDPPTRPRLPTKMIHHTARYTMYSHQQLINAINYMSSVLSTEGYYKKYSGREEYTWRDHMKHKFGGKWLSTVENRRLDTLKNQGYLSDVPSG